MTDKFIKRIAENRAKELFTKEFFETCTDSWYYDEFFRFKDAQVGIDSREPTDDEAYKYMGYIQEFKDIYNDNLYSSENAMIQYKIIINKLHEIMDVIDEGKQKYQKFECTDDIIEHLKSIGNYFVYKFNNEYNDTL